MRPAGACVLALFTAIPCLLSNAFELQELLPVLKLGNSPESNSQLSSESWRAFWGLRASPAARSIEERSALPLLACSLLALQPIQTPLTYFVFVFV